MSSFATLSASTAYLTLLQQINDRDADLSKALDPANTSLTAPLTGMVRFNSANKRWETYSGTTWGETIASATDAFNITVTGLRGGNLYGAVTNNGSITGGTVNALTLQAAGSAAWTAASLTNLNQLTNGPSYITGAALSPYAPTASPTFTGTPSAPTAAVDTTTAQLASTQFVVNQGYLKTAIAASTYLTQAAATTTYLTQTGGTLTGGLSGTTASFSGAATAANFSGPGTSLTGTAASLTAGAASSLPMYANGTSSVMMSRNGRSGTYSYVAYSDPNSPTGYATGLGFGGGASSGSAEILSDWLANGGVWHRSLRDTTENWSSWKKFLDDSNFNSYAPTLTGTGASGTWPITATAVAWTGVTSRPTALSGFTNDCTIGSGQAWTDVSVSRIAGAGYANLTGRPITVAVCVNQSSGAAVVIGGVTVMSVQASSVWNTLTFIVPAAATYSVTAASGITLWTELR